MSMEERRDRGDMIMTYNIVNNFVELGRDLLKFNLQGRTRGHKLKLEISRSRLEIRKNFFTKRVVSKWNSLMASTIESRTSESFKRAYDYEKGLVNRTST